MKDQNGTGKSSRTQGHIQLKKTKENKIKRKANDFGRVRVTFQKPDVSFILTMSIPGTMNSQWP